LILVFMKQDMPTLGSPGQEPARAESKGTTSGCFLVGPGWTGWDGWAGWLPEPPEPEEPQAVNRAANASPARGPILQFD